MHSDTVRNVYVYSNNEKTASTKNSPPQKSKTMRISGTHINYYRVCKRKLWLFANDIQMEQTSELVAEGKLIEEGSYLQRSSKYEQIELSAELKGITLSGKLDYFDTKHKVVHEVKKSNKVEEAHIWQVKFYLWLLELNEIQAYNGVIEYPQLREIETVFLEDEDRKYLKNSIAAIKGLLELDVCPPVIHAKICKNCSYYDFCYVREE